MGCISKVYFDMINFEIDEDEEFEAEVQEMRRYRSLKTTAPRQLPVHIEQWRLVDGYDNYEVSNFGRVRNTKTSRVLKPSVSSVGYHNVNLFRDGKIHYHTVHRLVAESFIPNPKHKAFVDHVDHNRLNNNVTNLRWVTRQQNNWNRSKKPNSSSVYKGVCWYSNYNQWVSQIYVNGKRKHLGYFDEERDAARAYDEASQLYHGRYGNHNNLFV